MSAWRGLPPTLTSPAQRRRRGCDAVVGEDEAGAPHPRSGGGAGVMLLLARTRPVQVSGT